jgi:hypothetical protein
MYNRNKIKHSLYLQIAIIVLFFSNVKAQSLSLEKDFLTDYLRNQQLIGADTDSNNIANVYSFTIRPLELNNAISKLYNNKPLKKGLLLLPIVFNSTINSHHPVGQNFGAMLPTTSPQIYLSSGLYLTHKRWEFQFQPEIIFLYYSKIYSVYHCFGNHLCTYSFFIHKIFQSNF